MNPATEVDEFFTQADVFLTEYVKNGRVSYARIHESPVAINALYEMIGQMDTGSLTPSEKKAFYINAYNLIVIYQVARYYPLKSPMDASGFFDGVKHLVAGERLTLNFLEYKKLLAVYKDARVHFALACAAKSCPPLASEAYTPEQLETQLDVRTRNAINNADWLGVDAGNREVKLSKIFQWYEKDFVASAGSILAFVNNYRTSSIPYDYSLDFYEYNWSLNE